jgi:hypothetical protein
VYRTAYVYIYIIYEYLAKHVGIICQLQLRPSRWARIFCFSWWVRINRWWCSGKLRKKMWKTHGETEKWARNSGFSTSMFTGTKRCIFWRLFMVNHCNQLCPVPIFERFLRLKWGKTKISKKKWSKNHGFNTFSMGKELEKGVPHFKKPPWGPSHLSRKSPFLRFILQFD